MLKPDGTLGRRLWLKMGWWRLPLSVAGTVSVASIQMIWVIGLFKPLFLALPLLLGVAVGLLWTALAVQSAGQQSENRLLRHLLEDTADVLILRDAEGFLYISPRIEQLSGYPPEVFEQTPSFFDRLVLKADRAGWRAYRQNLWQATTSAVHQHRFRIYHPEKGERWIRHEAHCFFYAGRRICRCVMRDESEQMSLKRLVARLQTTDFRTGLLQRAQVWPACERLQQDGAKVLTCLMLDVVDLHQINVRYGIEAGDAVLAVVGERIRHQQRRVPELAVAARWVGDNLLLVITADQTWTLSQIPRWRAEWERQVFVESQKLLIDVRLNLALEERYLYMALDAEGFEEMMRRLYRRLHAEKVEAALA